MSTAALDPVARPLAATGPAVARGPVVADYAGESKASRIGLPQTTLSEEVQPRPYVPAGRRLSLRRKCSRCQPSAIGGNGREPARFGMGPLACRSLRRLTTDHSRLTTAAHSFGAADEVFAGRLRAKRAMLSVNSASETLRVAVGVDLSQPVLERSLELLARQLPVAVGIESGEPLLGRFAFSGAPAWSWRLRSPGPPGPAGPAGAPPGAAGPGLA